MHHQEIKHIAVLSLLWEWIVSGYLDSCLVKCAGQAFQTHVELHRTFWPVTITIFVPFFPSDQKNLGALPVGGGGRLQDMQCILHSGCHCFCHCAYSAVQFVPVSVYVCVESFETNIDTFHWEIALPGPRFFWGKKMGLTPWKRRMHD